MWHAGLVIGVVAGCWIMRGAWGEGPPAGEDVMGHLTRVQYGLDHIFAQGKLDAWFPRFMLGHQMFLINGPGFTWIVGLVRLLTFGTLSLEGAVKAVAVGSYVGMVPAVAYLARSFGLVRPAAVVAGILSLGVSSYLGIGIEGIFVTGLIPQQVGAILLCLAVGSSLRLLDRQSRSLAAMAVFFSALLLLTHLRSALIAFLIVLLYGLGRLRAVVTRSSLSALVVSGSVALGLTAFWLIPLLVHRDLRGTFTAWGPSTIGSRLTDIWSGGLIYPPTMSKLVLLALVPALVLFALSWRRGLVLVWIPSTIFVLGYSIQHFWGAGEISVQLVDRAVGYVGILALFPLAALVGLVLPAHKALHILAAVVVAVSMVVATRAEAERVDSFSPAIPQMANAASTLNDIVSPTSRFVVQRDYPEEIARTGVIHPETWLVYRSERNALNVFGPELSPSWAWDEAERFGREDPSEAVDRLRNIGVTHAVATSREFSNTLELSEEFELVWREEPLAIFEVRTLPSDSDPHNLVTAMSEGDLSVDLMHRDPQAIRIETSSSSPAEVMIPLSWSPKWTVDVDGNPVSTRPTDEMLVSFSVPSGSHDVTIQFGPDRWDAIGRSITACVLVGILLSGIVKLRRKESVLEDQDPTP